MVMLGAGVTFYEGLDHIRDPRPIVDPHVNYIVLACSAVFEGTTWWIALREFRTAKGDLGYFEAARRSKDPPAFIVLFEDSAAMLGIAIAFLGTLAADRLAMPIFDGVAAIGISLVLAATAIMLARESKELLIGEPASARVTASILDLARQQPGVERANVVFTVHLAPDQIVVALSLEFSDNLTTPQIEERIVALVERAIGEAHPDVIAVCSSSRRPRAPTSRRGAVFLSRPPRSMGTSVGRDRAALKFSRAEPHPQGTRSPKLRLSAKHPKHVREVPCVTIIG